MSREIKFRGKSEISGEWIYGVYIDGYIINGVIDATNEYISIENWEPVDLNTVGQYTGLKDQFNTEIYEGDVVRHDFMVYEGHGSVGEDSTIDIIKNLTELPFGSSSIGCEVIGNIYENKNLLEDK